MTGDPWGDGLILVILIWAWLVLLEPVHAGCTDCDTQDLDSPRCVR